MKHSYGDVILETRNFDEAVETYNSETKDMKKGDFPEKFETLLKFTYVLVVNDSDYLDCEYRLDLDNTIYTREEFKNLKRHIKGNVK